MDTTSDTAREVPRPPAAGATTSPGPAASGVTGTDVTGTDPPGRWPALAILGTAVLLSMTTWFSASAVLPSLRELWGLSTTQAAWLTIAVQLGFVAGAMVSAILVLSDVIAPRRFVLIASIGAAVANLTLLWVPGAGAAIAARFVTGFFLAGVYPPALKEMSTWFRAGRGTALGVMVGALTLGSALPHLVNGLGGVAWQNVIVITSTLTLAGGLLAELAGRDGPFPFPRASFDVRSAGRAFSQRGVLLASAGYFGHMWELYAMWAWFAVFFATALEATGDSEVRTAAAFTAFLVIAAGAPGSVVGGLLGDHWGRTRSTILSMAISGTTALFIGLFHAGPIWVLVVLGLVWGFWVVADSAQFSTIVTEVAEQRYVGTALTLQLAIGFTLTVVTIWLVPVLVDSIGWQWAFAFLAPGPLLGSLAMWLLGRSPDAARIAGGRG